MAHWPCNLACRRAPLNEAIDMKPFHPPRIQSRPEKPCPRTLDPPGSAFRGRPIRPRTVACSMPTGASPRVRTPRDPCTRPALTLRTLLHRSILPEPAMPPSSQCP
jgi:hypothetical protein